MTTLPISLLPLGNGTLALCRMPGAVTPLADDIDRLLNLPVGAVLTLTPLHELGQAGAADLPGLLAQRGVAWHYLPIADFGAPLPAQDADWRALSAQLHARLDRGETIAIHCRAGMGRTGMIALRLMCERGEDPQQALARLRACRPGTVERAAQFDWAAAGAKP